MKYYKVSTIENRLYEVKIFLNYLENIGFKDNFEAVDYLKFLEFRYADKAYKRSYTNKIIQHLCCFYEFLEQEGKITYVPGWLYEKARPEERIANVLSMYEIFLIEKQFTGSVTDLRDAAIIETLLSTGLRISECLNLKLADYRNNTFNVVTKGDRERLIILNECALEKIDRYLKNRTTLSIFLFSNLNGGRLTTSYVDKMILCVTREAGIKRRISAHTFRHTYCALLGEGGANIIEQRDMLGHASIRSTEVYAKSTVEHLRKEMALAHPAW